MFLLSTCQAGARGAVITIKARCDLILGLNVALAAAISCRCGSGYGSGSGYRSGSGYGFCEFDPLGLYFFLELDALVHFLGEA